jgi:hypothetical protein
MGTGSTRAGVGSITPEIVITRGGVIRVGAVSGANIANIVGTRFAVITLAVVCTAASSGFTGIGRFITGLTGRASFITRVLMGAGSSRTSVGTITPETVVTGCRVVRERTVSCTGIADIVGTGIAVLTLAIARTATTTVYRATTQTFVLITGIITGTVTTTTMDSFTDGNTGVTFVGGTTAMVLGRFPATD